MVEYETIIGMEVHAQLLTRSKMFCRDDAQVFGAEPNTHVCPVCLGMPGVLPTANRRAIEQVIMVGLALNCQVAERAVFSRKNYFYPDLPKSYQISMYDLPLCQHGWIEIEDGDGPDSCVKRIGVRRVHLEEDTAKLIHAGDHSLVDFNRSGLALMEVVTEPDIRTPEQARQYLVNLRAILRFLGVSTGDMEKGALRCEPNVSVRRVGAKEFGTKVEVKNLNSFRSVKLALEYEVGRQIRILEAGEQVRQVTMGWDEDRGRTFEQRTKEESDDYRYFPEPDLTPLHIAQSWISEIRAQMPELPRARQARFVVEHGLSPADAAALTADRATADYFDAAVAAGQACGISPRTVGNWVTGELFRLLREEDSDLTEARVEPAAIVALIDFVEQDIITAGTGKAVLKEIFITGRPAESIIQEKGLAQISDEQQLSRLVDDIIAANPEQVARYRAGKETLLGWFMGQVMRETRGKASPQVVKDLLQRKLKG